MALTAGTATNTAIGPDAGTIGQCLANTFRGSINAYVAAVEDKVQLLQWWGEQQSAIDGYGVISGGTLSAGAGLSVNVAAYAAVIGNYLTTGEAGTCGGLTDDASNTIYLYQDGHIDTTGTVSSHGPSMAWGVAVAASGTVSSVTQVRRFRQRQYGGTSIPYSAGTTTLAPEQFGYPLLRFSGTATGTVIVQMPEQAFAAWDVINAGSATAAFCATSGGSVLVATTKAARITYDGTDYVRLAADV